MVTKIYEHEPSRHLFMGICDATQRLVDSPDGAPFMETLFSLEKEFHPSGVAFSYMIPFEDHLEVDLNGQFTYDAKFFVPKQLANALTFLRQLYHDLAKAAESYRSRRGFSADHRTEVERYVPYPLKLGVETKDKARKAIALIREYFLRTHILVQ